MGSWKPKSIVFFCVVFFCCTACSQSEQRAADPMAVAPEDSIPELIAAGLRYIGKPYQSGKLDVNSVEVLVVDTTAFDCVTFVETVIAETLTGTKASAANVAFCDVLRQWRYRNGVIRGYASRLHYFSDWLYEQAQQGRVKILTDQYNGERLPVPIQYMTAHRSAYPKLKDENTFQEIQQTEAVMNNREMYYVPKSDKKWIRDHIREGDIIAVTTRLKGLDISHCGIAIRQGGEIHLLHASSEYGRVLISKVPLTEYLNQNAAQTGIIAARLIW